MWKCASATDIMSICLPFSTKWTRSRLWSRLVHSTATGTKGDEGRDVISSWDKWEYGTFPINGTFGKKISMTTSGGKTISKTVNTVRRNAEEEEGDEKEFDPLWTHLSDEQVQLAVETLEKFTTDDRRQRMRQILAQRTNHVRFVFENPSNANNVWAALRTLDSFGVQFVDIIFNNETHISEWRKSTMRAALGSQKWMTLKQHDSTAQCLQRLKDDGYKIIASDLHASSLQSDRIDWRALTKVQPHATTVTCTTTSSSTSPLSDWKVAIVMGNENTGITQLTRDIADHLLYIPMRGFAESLNLSVAVAVLCTQLDHQAMLKCGLTTPIENRVLLTWLARSVRRSWMILEQQKIPVPFESMFERINNVTTRP